MAKLYKVGNFQLNTVSGAQAITGVGFQPKALLFYHQPVTIGTGVPQIANWYWSMGMADASNQYAMWTFAPNGNGGLESSLYAQNNSNAIYAGSNGSVYHYASVTSLDGDGFTINVGAPPHFPGVPYMVG